jgi:hypothetical protein
MDIINFEMKMTKLKVARCLIYCNSLAYDKQANFENSSEKDSDHYQHELEQESITLSQLLNERENGYDEDDEGDSSDEDEEIVHKVLIRANHYDDDDDDDDDDDEKLDETSSSYLNDVEQTPEEEISEIVQHMVEYIAMSFGEDDEEEEEYKADDIQLDADALLGRRRAKSEAHKKAQRLHSVEM